MISVVIPTLNAADGLANALRSLLEANTQGLIREVIISDGGSKDDTCAMAEAAGARVVIGPPGRGGQLARGAAAARGSWLLFLHADTELSEDWPLAAQRHIGGAYERVAATFRLRFDQPGIGSALVARGANLRSRLFGLPYGDQGLLIARSHYDRLGGFHDMPLFEDVDIVRRIIRDGGRRALTLLSATARTSAARYERDGYIVRVLRNSKCVRMYFRGAPIEKILEVYHGNPSHRPSPRPDGQAAIDGPREDPPQP